MIKIKSIKLTNFGRHKHIENYFDGHVIGLAGPNGKGKSTVLQALQYALTGSIQHPDPLRAFIRNTSGDKPPKAAEVEVTFMANGRAGTITRRITRTSSSRALLWDGEKKPITADKEVSRVFQEILGVDKRAIDSTVFIKQGEMDSMFGTDKERRDFYTRLLMLGHLEKVAGIVEVSRASLASSLQDLGVARDTADATYNEARIFFESMDDELKNHKDNSPDLKAAREISGLFGDQSEAAEDIRKAETELSTMIPEAETPSDWVDTQKRLKDKLKEERESLEKKREKHDTLKDDAAAADKDHATKKRSHDLFKQLEEAKAKAKELGELGEDPAEKIKVQEERQRKLDTLSQLSLQLQEAKSELEEREKKLPAMLENIDVLQENYDKSRRHFAVTDNNMKMKQELLARLQKHADDDEGHNCPLCGADSPPDEEHLERAIDQDQEVLNELRNTGLEAADKLRAAKAEVDPIRNAVNTAKSNIEKWSTEVKRLRIETSLYDEAKVTTELERLYNERKEFSTREFRHKTAHEEVAKLEEIVKGDAPTTSEEVEVSVEKMNETALAFNNTEWTATASNRYKVVCEELDDLAHKLEAASSRISALTNAKDRTTMIEKKLAQALKVIPEGFFDNFTSAGTALTSQEVEAKIESLEAKQKVYDEQRGRLDGARQSLKAASKRVSEIELRAAEQKERLAIVDDLALIRDTFKPDGASLEYLNYKFGKIARVAGDYLAESGADFMVTASDDTPLAYDFLRTDRADEVWMPQSRLSGGQKVRLAVATLRAIHSEVMPDVGIMALDEPTTHLDADACESMADMLRQIGGEETLQMIVCDHSPTLIDAFSDMINIPD